jgi:fumarate hydratase class II
MDATPIRLGQEFSGYASQVAHADRRIMQKVIILRELPIGGTAVGTGINTHPEFARLVCEILNHETRESFHEAPNHFEAQARQGHAGRHGRRALKVDRDQPDQDRQRHPHDGQRAALRHRRAAAAGGPAGQLDHAGQGQPGHSRGGVAGCAHVVGNEAAVSYAGGCWATSTCTSACR